MNKKDEGAYPEIKTILEYLISVLLLILLIPVVLILIFIIKATSRGPFIYSQERIGKSGKSFILYKFRSMYTHTQGDVPLLTSINDKRITKIGRFMRNHKLDEIPNLVNVMKGEMSLIGPRPEQPYFINHIIEKKPEYTILLGLKPGITSWGQIKYGYASDVDQMVDRIKYDIYYFENRSFLFDLKIAFQTILVILRGQGR